MTTSYGQLTDLLYAEKRYGQTVGRPPIETVSNPSALDAQRYCGVVDPAVVWLESSTYLRAQHWYAIRPHDGMEIRPMFELVPDHECEEAEDDFTSQCSREWEPLRLRGAQATMVIMDEVTINGTHDQ